MRFFFGLIVGAALALAWAYREQIRAVWNNRAAITAGGQAVSGISEAVEGVRSLVDALDGGSSP